MRVARYWGSVDVVRPAPDCERPYRHRVWGGSDVSQAEADAAAKRRAAGMRRVPIPSFRDRRGHDSYGTYPDCSMPEPLIDDIVDAGGRRVGAVTINGYGVEVLNTVSLGFVDIDLPEQGAIGRRLRRLFGGKGPEDAAFARIVSWTDGEPGRGARVYRTAGGLRVLITGPAMDPAGEATAELMENTRADRRYAELCRMQKSFRARLTPKPWRVGVERPKLRYDAYVAGGAWVTDWLGRYRAACAGYAVCRLIGEVGGQAGGRAAVPDAGVASMIELHDTATRAGEDLPLA